MTVLCIHCRGHLEDGVCKGCGRNEDGSRTLTISARQALAEAREAIKRTKGKR